jgi:hypothetical protein
MWAGMMLFKACDSSYTGSVRLVYLTLMYILGILVRYMLEYQ